MKLCKDCNTVKTLEDFHRNRHHSDGRQGFCKPCHNTRARNWRRAQPDYHKVRLARDPNYFRRHKIKGRYGLTLDAYDEMLKSQNGVCEICKQPPSYGQNLAIDHDHITGKIRDLLCHDCNRKLGLLEQINWTTRGFIYLAKHEYRSQ